MCFQAPLFSVVISSLLVATSTAQKRSSPGPNTNFKCEVTKANDIAAGQDKPAPGSYGNREVSVGPFGLWPDGTIVFKPGFMPGGVSTFC